MFHVKHLKNKKIADLTAIQGERRINMKVLKRATQKNVLVDYEWYTVDEINVFLDKHILFTFDDDIRESYEHINYSDVKNVRLFLDKVNELKVIYNREMECYATVAVMNDGNYIYVRL